MKVDYFEVSPWVPQECKTRINTMNYYTIISPQIDQHLTSASNHISLENRRCV